MCGRYSLATKQEVILEQFEIELPRQLEISFNIAPTQQAYVLTNTDSKHISKMHWGLIPSWSKTSALTGKMINARSEGIFDKPSFKEAILQRRCLIPADSFYEWRKEGKTKKPYRIFPKHDQLLVFAGIWEINTKSENNIYTFSIITCPANRDVANIHTRMPVILYERSDQEEWLADISTNRIKDLLAIPSSNRLDMYPISTKVNSPVNNTKAIHDRIPDTLTLFD